MDDAGEARLQPQRRFCIVVADVLCARASVGGDQAHADIVFVEGAACIVGHGLQPRINHGRIHDVRIGLR